jgi:hypothetical protein
MFDQIRRVIKKLTVEAVPFDPASIGDDLATQISWSPARSGGANFRTHKLVIKEPFLAEFKTTIGHLIFGLIFALVGLGFALGFAYFIGSSMDNVAESLMFSAIPVIVGLSFTGAGVWLISSALSPIRFDKGTGDFRKGRKAKNAMVNLETNMSSGIVRLDDIHAIQLISERCSSSDSSYMSYELNLVLENGKRMNVVDHGGLSKIREDANRLGDFLGVPVWDAT